MGNKVKQYAWKGLDLRTNILYRKDGTSSDIRNMTLDSNRRLRKRVDMASTIIPRGIDGETGEFLDKLPFDAEIIDLVKYDDYFVIATRIKKIYNISGDDKYIYVNKFYKWTEDTNIVEFIPFNQRTTDDPDIGQVKDRVASNIGGRFSVAEQEDILFFSGEYVDTDLSNTPAEIIAQLPFFESEREDNLSYIYTYDGSTICVSGCPALVGDTALQDATVTDNEFVRVLPFKIDAQDRNTFGNYTTHLSVYGAEAGLVQEVTIPQGAIDTTTEERQAFFRCTQSKSFFETDSAVDRTISMEFYESAGIGALGVSVAKGQVLYHVEQFQTSPPYTTGTESYVVYRVTVEDVDYIAKTVTLKDFKKYSASTGRFETTDKVELENGHVVSNILVALYGSSDRTFGFEFRGLSTMANVGDGVDFYELYYTKNGVSTFTNIYRDPLFLFLKDRFEDTYDEETVKLPPPKVRSFSKYIGAIVAVDSKVLYFSDFSLGGNIETFTPFDTFPVGSSDFGPITGLFGNETFLAVFRQEETYYISGNIFTANYRIQSYKSTRIGCSDPRSIIDYRGAGVFASEKGLFVCSQGGAMEELSDIIEPLFSEDALGLSLNMSNVVGMVDFIGERLLFSFDDYLLEFNYYYKEWLLHDGIPMNGGSVISERKLYTSDGVNILKEAGTYTESIAYRRSNFETLQAPSLLKKFHRVLIFTPSIPTDFSLTVNTYKNWDLSEKSTEEEKDGTANQVDVTQRFNPDSVKSMAMEIYSPSGQPFISEGYEYEYGGFSRDFQDDD